MQGSFNRVTPATGCAQRQEERKLVLPSTCLRSGSASTGSAERKIESWSSKRRLSSTNGGLVVVSRRPFGEESRMASAKQENGALKRLASISEVAKVVFLRLRSYSGHSLEAFSKCSRLLSSSSTIASVVICPAATLLPARRITHP